VFPQSIEISAELFNELLARCTGFLHDRIFPHVISLTYHEFFRRRNIRGLETGGTADIVDPGKNDCIRKMSAIPREQVINSIHRRDRNVQRISVGLRRQSGFAKKTGSELACGLSHVREPQLFDDTHSCLGIRGVTAKSLIDDDRRCE